MDSGDHLHTGVVAVIWVTVAAVVGLNLWRLAAMQAAKSDKPMVASIGRSAGALVTFGG